MAVVWRFLAAAAIVAFVAIGMWAESTGHIPAQVFHEMGRGR